MSKRSIFKRLLEPWEAIDLVATRIGSKLRDRLLHTLEHVILTEAVGRLIASNIPAPRSLPWYPRSLVDGCAVRSVDVAGAFEDRPVKLAYSGRVPIGEKPRKSLEPGGCIEVDTGSWVPKGADAVVPIEYVRIIDGKEAYIERSVSPGQNIAMPASDVAEGDIIAYKGQPVSPILIASLAALGLKEIPVTRRVRVAVFSTGEELVEPGEDAGEAGIYDANRFYLKSKLKSLNWEVVDLGIAPDDLEAVEDAIGKALDHGSDVIIASGGTSAGVDDVVYRALKRLGELIVHGIRIKPGKPTILGVIGDTLFLGLPGNPRSCINVFEKIGIPLLVRVGILASLESPLKVTAPLAHSLTGERGRHTIAPIALIKGVDSSVAIPVSIESYMIASYALSDGYTVIPSTRYRPLEQGTPVEIELWRIPPETLVVLTDTIKVSEVLELIGRNLRPIYKPTPEQDKFLSNLPANVAVITKSGSSRRLRILKAWTREVLLLRRRTGSGECSSVAVPIEYLSLAGNAAPEALVIPVPRAVSAITLYRDSYADCAIIPSEYWSMITSTQSGVREATETEKIVVGRENIIAAITGE